MTAAVAPPAPPPPRTVVHLITTLGQGGAERVLTEVVPRPGEIGIDRRPERHIVVSLTPGGAFREVLVARGVEVRDLGMRPGRDLVGGLRGLLELRRELRPDLVVGWMYHACLLLLLAAPVLHRRGTRTVWFLQGSLHTLEGLPWHTRAAVRILAWTSRVPETVAINSRIGLEHHADLGYRPRHWTLLENGCDTGAFRPDADERTAVRAELGLDPSTVLAISVARVHPQKDHPTLLAAIRHARGDVPDLALLLVGIGTDGLAATQADGGHVIGLGGRDDVARLLRGADLFVLSSTTEGIPNALLEAMASGLPVVATDVGDCRRVIGGAGRVVPPRDASALARALIEVATIGPEDRAALGALGRERIVVGHDLGVARLEYRALWDRAAAGRARSGRPVHVAHVIARMNVGGPARILVGLLDGIDPAAVEQTLITGAVGTGEEDWFTLRGGEDPRVLRIPSFGRAVDPLADLRTLRRLTAELRRLAPDVVQTHTAKAGLIGRLAARRAGVPHVVHTFHGHTLHGYFPRPVTAAFTALERWLAPRTDRLLAVGARVRDELLAAGVGRPEQYIVLPPGVPEPASQDRAAARAALGLPPDGPVVAFIGRLTAVKRPDRFIAAAHAVAATQPRAIFLVVGDGEQRTAVEAAATSGPADVRMLGWRSDVDVVLAACDVVALTSDNEGMPLTLIEAAMAGRAAVTTDVGSAGEVVLDGRTGRVVPPEADAVAAALADLLADPAAITAAGTAARDHARATFGLPALVARVTELHRGLAGLDG